jgi:hypothetical protein
VRPSLRCPAIGKPLLGSSSRSRTELGRVTDSDACKAGRERVTVTVGREKGICVLAVEVGAA